MPAFYMLIGVPASGKSTWVSQNRRGAVVISSDDYIEKQAARLKSTYNDVFNDYIKDANRHATETAKQAFADGLDVIWDQTNLTRNSRKGKLSMVPKNYEKIAVYFPTPSPDLHRKRLDGRPGKKIPDFVLNSMIKTLEPPSKDEGFDEIITA